jgi:hypothetical protein
MLTPITCDLMMACKLSRRQACYDSYSRRHSLHPADKPCLVLASNFFPLLQTEERTTRQHWSALDPEHQGCPAWETKQQQPLRKEAQCRPGCCCPIHSFFSLIPEQIAAIDLAHPGFRETSHSPSAPYELLGRISLRRRNQVEGSPPCPSAA